MRTFTHHRLRWELELIPLAISWAPYMVSNWVVETCQGNIQLDLPAKKKITFLIDDFLRNGNPIFRLLCDAPLTWQYDVPTRFQDVSTGTLKKLRHPLYKWRFQYENHEWSFSLCICWASYVWLKTPHRWKASSIFFHVSKHFTFWVSD